VGDVLGIPFRRVTMIKATAAWTNPIADALAYSYKNVGQYRSDRSIVKGTMVEDRYVAPPDLIARMAEQCEIVYNHGYDFADGEGTPTISTIPMPRLMELLAYPHPPTFNAKAGRNIHAQVHSADAFVSLIVPHPNSPISRVSITGDEAIIECTDNNRTPASAEDIVGIACELLGFNAQDVHTITEHKQQYAKIQPIDEATRKNFMFWATDKFNIFSLGRFATWRPGLLMDDLVQDVRKIEGWIQGSRYDLVRAR
jgi:hypothetical protein